MDLKRCLPCDVPFSTDGARIFCIYCDFSRDTSLKKQSVSYTSDGRSRLFKIPSFKAVNMSSVTVTVDGLPKQFTRDFSVAVMSGAVFMRMHDIPLSGKTVVIEWEDQKP